MIMAVASEARLIRCPSCGTTNRVPMDKVESGLKPVCGKCRTPVSVSAGPVTVTDATFSAEVECSPLPVVLDIWAEWCGPCRMIAPVLDELASEMAGKVKVAKLNIDENPATTHRFKVRSIPTILILRDGREVDRIVGVLPRSEISKRIHQAIK
jgi:thioredoxin 2